MLSARKSQDIGALCVFKIAPMAKNNRHSRKADVIPLTVPHSRASRPLFFFVAIKPPKKDEVYMAKNERGVI